MEFLTLEKELNISEIKTFLDEKEELYNRPNFIEYDPISIPHNFSKKENIEISGFLAATLAWGQRKTIIKNANKIIEAMDFAPYDFIINHTENDILKLENFVHRTFNFTDLSFFIKSLKNIYLNNKGLEQAFSKGKNLEEKISNFRKIFFEIDFPERTQKHVSNPSKNSSCKRICMYLRWMVRDDKKGVDLGIWNSISTSELRLPLDIHTGNVSRKLGILTRKQNDWKAVNEVSTTLALLDKKDPIKYDFALFGLGAIENF